MDYIHPAPQHAWHRQPLAGFTAPPHSSQPHGAAARLSSRLGHTGKLGGELGEEAHLPTRRSVTSSWLARGIAPDIIKTPACSGEVSELVDEQDLGSCAARRAGSTPAFPTSVQHPFQTSTSDSFRLLSHGRTVSTKLAL